MSEGSGRLKSQVIIEKLDEMEDRPWAEWSRGRPMIPQQMSRLLRPFGIRSRAIRFEGGRLRATDRVDFDDAFSRICRDQSVTPSQSNNNNEVGCE